MESCGSGCVCLCVTLDGSLMGSHSLRRRSINVDCFGFVTCVCVCARACALLSVGIHVASSSIHKLSFSPPSMFDHCIWLHLLSDSFFKFFLIKGFKWVKQSDMTLKGTYCDFPYLLICSVYSITKDWCFFVHLKSLSPTHTHSCSIILCLIQ